MADEEQPPPRKVGSLRDRIAQFEKKPESSAPPPIARPAPKQWAWKAKQEAAVSTTTPTDAPVPARDRSPSPPPPQRPAFSSSDAREAISGAGGFGSLKERMAALQGRNMGAVPPPSAPKKIVVEREEKKEDEPAEDEDEEEKARRARIAERMAKLGGARVGMAPVFSRPQKHEEDESKSGDQSEEVKPPTDQDAKPAATDEPTDEPESEAKEPGPPTDEPKPAAEEPTDEPKDPVADVTSPEPVTSPPPSGVSPHSPPTSMPIPAAPKRAAPPRKKAKKPVEESKPEPEPKATEAVEPESKPEPEESKPESEDNKPETHIESEPVEDTPTLEAEDKPTPEVERKPSPEPIETKHELAPKEEERTETSAFAQAKDIGTIPVPLEPQPGFEREQTTVEPPAERAPTPPLERPTPTEQERPPVERTPSPIERAPTPPVERAPTPIQRVSTPPPERIPTPPFSPVPVHPGAVSPIARPESPIPRPESPRPASLEGPEPTRPESPIPVRATSPVPVPVRAASPVPVRAASPIPVRASSPIPVRSTSPVPVPVRATSPIPARSGSPIPLRPDSPAARSRSPSLPARSVSPVAARALSPRPVSPTTLPSSPPVRRAGTRRASLLRSEVPLADLRKEAERAELEETESEEGKKANLAARMAKLGGVSMFGPQRRSSVEVERKASLDASVRKEPFPTIPTDEELAEAERRGSMESLTGMHSEEPLPAPRDEHEPFSPQSRATPPLRKTSLGSVGRKSSWDAGSARKSSGEVRRDSMGDVPGSEVQTSPQRSPSIRRSIPPPAVPEEQPSPIEESTPPRPSLPPPPRPNLPPPPPPEFVAPPPPPAITSPPASSPPPPPPVASPPAPEPFVAPPPPPAHPAPPPSELPVPPRPANAPPPPPPAQEEEEEEEPTDAVSSSPPPIPSSPPPSSPPQVPSSPPPVPTTQPPRRPSIPIPERESDYTSPARSPVDHSRAAQFIGLAQPEDHPLSKSETAQIVTDEETEEQARRRTIAQRMAKLGGLKFGMPGVAPPVPRRQPTNPPEEVQEEEDSREATPVPAPASAPAPAPVTEEPLVDDGSEESERARKERIAAKMAAMGGMRFGMLPPGAGGPLGRPPPPSAAPPPPTAAPPPPPLAVPPRPPSSAPPPPPFVAPPPPPVPTKAKSPERGVSEADDFATVSEGQSLEEEGVHVEAEVSEPEQLGMEPEEEEEEPTPPPRPANRPPPVPHTTPPSRLPPPVPQTSADVQPQGFTMVEAPGDDSEPEDVPPPPPRPSTRPPPPPSSRPPPPPEESDFEHAGVDEYMTRSLVSEDETNYPTPQAAAAAPTRPSRELPVPPKPTVVRPTAAAPPGPEPDPDMLMVLWGKVGVQVTQSALALAEKGKKSIVGDGTSTGFVTAVLAGVDNAYKASFGWPVFIQNGPTVQRRSSDIMPGDIIVMTDIKLKGHKGLQGYSTHVSGELVGIVSEFEAKKHKVKVWQPALQANTYPTVESVNYRLEDLKSGTIQVYRVAEYV
ncbi:Nascent polypeptide-associated complex subunit alpha, muscle-specific form [Rhizoctonia solani]|uniref:Nascent polypeptide-associated complex subunit alpha, muscle-specific form n=1 Tax=Rhizoctonia solani TaxID=456999 RepID=A0A0K6FS16_9AGAM|nr:Nascent polypeptide-associated complex subunit alpha, muscle-specific form [Rhizoctonia solani]